VLQVHRWQGCSHTHVGLLLPLDDHLVAMHDLAPYLHRDVNDGGGRDAVIGMVHEFVGRRGAGRRNAVARRGSADGRPRAARFDLTKLTVIGRN
jgi:hypothetical protein